VLLLISKSSIFTAAANWTRLILLGIYSGLNLTYLLLDEGRTPGQLEVKFRTTGQLEVKFRTTGQLEVML
jgi:hypothetical protein